MEVEKTTYNVRALVAAVNSNSLARNEEYQRGEAWTLVQKAGFLDSLFRGYPVPALFLYKIVSHGLGGDMSTKYEIVDGQQRLAALRDYLAGKMRLLGVGSDSRLRLPRSLRDVPAPWAGKFYNELSDDLRSKLDACEMSVFVIQAQDSSDEVRDLFIRLQSGTALTRQQIRDAWPGNLGPYIERLAGKLDKQPAHEIFGVIDKRGQRTDDEDQRDTHVADRQVCAQLLRIFTSREADYAAFPSVSANELDALYHEYTDFDPGGTLAQRFILVLDRTAEVFKRVKTGKRKLRRLDVTCAMMFVQDITKNPLAKLDATAIKAIADDISKAESKERPGGKSTSSRALKMHYDWWREHLQNHAIQLDPIRLFNEDQKRQLRERSNGLCGVCNEVVIDGEGEYDHFPMPHRDGGPTTVANGRLVHVTCHERGRPKSDIMRAGPADLSGSQIT